MRAPQHERRARPPARGVAREPAEATLQGLTPTSPTPLPSWVRRLTASCFPRNEFPDQHPSSSLNEHGCSHPRPGSPHPTPVQQLLPCPVPPAPGDPRSKLPAPKPALAACSIPCPEGGRASPALHTTSAGSTEADRKGWILALPLCASTSPSAKWVAPATRTRPEGCLDEPALALGLADLRPAGSEGKELPPPSSGPRSWSC